MTRPRAAARLLVAVALLAAGCGEARRPRRAGNFQAVRLRRDVPRHARLGAADLEVVHVPSGSVPDHRRYPRGEDEVLGTTLRLARPAGTLLQDAHLDLHPMAPESGAATLEPGELGLLAPLRGLPPEVEAGAVLRVEGAPVLLRLAAVSPPGPGVRDALLAGPRTPVLDWARQGAAFPVEVVAVVDCLAEACPRPAREPARTRPPGKGPFLVAARDLTAGHTLEEADLSRFHMPPSLLPAGALAADEPWVGQQVRAEVVEGEVVTRALLAAPTGRAETTTLYVPGLHPDWLHPGATALYLRATPGADPVEVEVLDMDRAGLGAPVPLTVRPLPGEAWPQAGRRNPGEGGRRRWSLLLQR